MAKYTLNDEDGGLRQRAGASGGQRQKMVADATQQESHRALERREREQTQRQKEQQQKEQHHERQQLDQQESDVAAPGVCCRICLQEDKMDNMLEPCGCRGSIAYAHQDCLQAWLAQRNTSICELCGQVYKVKVKLTWHVLLLPYSSWLALSLLLLSAINFPLGAPLGEPAGSRCCWGYSRPWRRGIRQLFKACDADDDGQLSVREMWAMANFTGEQNVTEDMLATVVNIFGRNNSGITVDSLMLTYWIPHNDSTLLADFHTFGLQGALEPQTGDLGVVWHVAACVFCISALWELWSVTHSFSPFAWLTALFLAYVVQPLVCRWSFSLIAFMGWMPWQMAWILSATRLVIWHLIVGIGDGAPEHPLVKVLRSLVYLEMAWMLLVLEGHVNA